MKSRKRSGKGRKPQPIRHHFGRAVAKAVPAIAVLLILFAAIAVFDKLGHGITGFAVKEKEANALFPQDRITESQIRAGEEAVVVRIANATVGRLESTTNSMAPLLDANTTVIMIRPNNAGEVKKGDIIAYYSEEAGGLVAHRVIGVGSDELGWFAVTKGDSSLEEDPKRVRFGQVRYVVVGILY